MQRCKSLGKRLGKSTKCILECIRGGRSSNTEPSALVALAPAQSALPLIRRSLLIVMRTSKMSRMSKMMKRMRRTNEINSNDEVWIDPRVSIRQSLFSNV